MGNSIAKKFNDVPKEHTATAGHSQLWKIWPGKSKETGADVSIWTFDRAELSKRKTNPVTDKAMLEQIFQIMKKDLSCLKENSAVAGGGIVQFVEGVEETSSTLVFTTERVICSLADILGGFESISGGRALHAEFFDASGAISELEISRGFVNIAEGLQYLHTVQRRLHVSISPESVVICASGQWKLCGLGFSLNLKPGEPLRFASPYFMKSMPNNHLARLEPDLRYCSPELTTGGLAPQDTRYLTPASDVFSLGILGYEVYRYNLKLIQDTRPHTPLIEVANNSALHHDAALTRLGSTDYSFLPHDIAQLLYGMMQPVAVNRIGAPEVINSPYFTTGPLAVLKVLDALPSRDVGTQSSQMTMLPGQLTMFPVRLIESSVLVATCRACESNPALWASCLPVHISILPRISLAKYRTVTGPYITKGLENGSSAEGMQAFLKHVVFVQETFESAAIGSSVLTLICNALDKQQANTQMLALQGLCEPCVREGIDLQNVVDKVVPRVCKEACKNTDSNVKVLALYVLSMVSNRLDRMYMVKNIVPSLKYISDNEKNPNVWMGVVGNYDAIADSLGAEYLCTAVIPIILPMLVDRTLDRKQFEMVYAIHQNLMKKVVEMRASEMSINLAALDMASIDPFAAAKAMIVAAKRETQQQQQSVPSYSAGATSSYSYPGAPMSSTSVGTSFSTPQVLKAPPPLPSSAPPPVPSMPPPPVPGRSAAVEQAYVPDQLPYSSSSSSTSLSYASPNVAVPVSMTSSSAASGNNSAAWFAQPNPLAMPGTAQASTSSAALPPFPPSTGSSSSSSSSGFGWFGAGSSKTKDTAEAYQPPVPPPPAVTSYGATATATASYSSQPLTQPQSQTQQPIATNIDMNDFMSSFSKPAAQQAAPLQYAQPQSQQQQQFAQQQQYGQQPQYSQQQYGQQQQMFGGSGQMQGQYGSTAPGMGVNMSSANYSSTPIVGGYGNYSNNQPMMSPMQQVQSSNYGVGGGGAYGASPAAGYANNLPSSNNNYNINNNNNIGNLQKGYMPPAVGQQLPASGQQSSSGAKSVGSAFDFLN